MKSTANSHHRPDARGGCADFRDSLHPLTRRQVVRAGALSIAGLELAQLLSARSQAAPASSKGFGRAKSCIVIFMWGGPSQLDTWDPKPDAPVEIRGSFKSIETRTPGVRISEHFPLLAARTDRLAIIRSLTHDDPAHLSSAHRTLTGHLAPRPFSDADGPSPNDSPHLGALVSRFRPAGRAGLPTAVTMPWTVAHPAAPGGRAPGQDAGWLGKAFEPFRVEGDPNAAGFHVEGLSLPSGVDAGRFAVRRELLSSQSAVHAAGLASPWEGFQTRALDTLASSQARAAFDIEREPPKLRDKYGRHIHGQCLLLARRLVEAGVPLVTVNWHDDGQNFWDTHGDNFNQLKNRLMPPADQGFAALLDDLEARGMLDSTLVAWVGEFGRTPRTTNGGTGREHWPRCYSAVMAGGGIAGGQVFGASDRWAAYPARDAVSPDDYAATILHGLGIDPGQQLRDGLGRPMPINMGQPLTALFA